MCSYAKREKISFHDFIKECFLVMFEKNITLQKCEGVMAPMELKAEKGSKNKEFLRN